MCPIVRDWHPTTFSPLKKTKQNKHTRKSNKFPCFFAIERMANVLKIVRTCIYHNKSYSHHHAGIHRCTWWYCPPQPLPQPTQMVLSWPPLPFAQPHWLVVETRVLVRLVEVVMVVEACHNCDPEYGMIEDQMIIKAMKMIHISFQMSSGIHFLQLFSSALGTVEIEAYLNNSIYITDH